MRCGAARLMVSSTSSCTPARGGSSNPATQARDLALLAPLYHVTAVQPVDMFPHTHHVENVVRLDRNTD